MKNILLCSGGMDSMVIYHMMKNDIDECVYVRYRGNHPATLQELKCIERTGIDVRIVDIDDIESDERGFYFGRNLTLMLTLRKLYKDDNINVIIGNTANDNFSDNTRMFFYQLEDVINRSFPNTMRITCPLENMTKSQILKIAIDNKIDFYFCDNGTDEPCGKCHSCLSMIDCGYMMVNSNIKRIK